MEISDGSVQNELTKQEHNIILINHNRGLACQHKPMRSPASAAGRYKINILQEGSRQCTKSTPHAAVWAFAQYRARQLFFILLLPLIWLVVFKYAPMVGVQIAFRDFKIRAGMWGSEWIGVENFIKFSNRINFLA